MSSDHSKKRAPGHGAGLRPAIAEACRFALRDAVGGESAEHESAERESAEHIEACGYCKARVQATATLAKWVSARPEVPAALAAPSVLEGIYERAAEAVEQGPLGAWLEQSEVEAAEVDATEVRDCIGETDSKDVASRNAVMRDLVRNPVLPDAQVWNGVCRSILDGVASERVIRRQTGWRVLLAGAAAAAVVGFLSIQEDVPAQPTIVFADLDGVPDVAFANARYPSRN